MSESKLYFPESSAELSLSTLPTLPTLPTLSPSKALPSQVTILAPICFARSTCVVAAALCLDRSSVLIKKIIFKKKSLLTFGL